MKSSVSTLLIWKMMTNDDIYAAFPIVYCFKSIGYVFLGAKK